MNVLDWPLSRPRVLVPLLGASHSLAPHPHPVPPRFPSLVRGAGGVGGCPGPTFLSLPAIVPSSCGLATLPGPPPAAESGDSFPFFLVT